MAFAQYYIIFGVTAIGASKQSIQCKAKVGTPYEISTFYQHI